MVGGFEMESNPHYFSFLLRIWLAGDGAGPQWRASLEDTHTGERMGFGSLEAMCAYLKQQLYPGMDRPEENEEK